jgi:glycosyltransferase involved in cell wall biosynthesis
MNRCSSPITDAWIAVAESLGEFLSQWEKFPAGRVQVIRNGIDCSKFKADRTQRSLVRQELGVADEVPFVGIIAALRSEKNHTAFIQMAERLRDRFPTTHWVIVGDGPERASIEAEIAKRGFTD